MSGNSIGKLFSVTTFGESHGPALGGVVDGCPPGMALSESDLQPDLDRRRPGTSYPIYKFFHIHIYMVWHFLALNYYHLLPF